MVLCVMVEIIFYIALTVIGLFTLKIALQLLAVMKIFLTYDCGQDDIYPN